MKFLLTNVLLAAMLLQCLAPGAYAASEPCSPGWESSLSELCSETSCSVTFPDAYEDSKPFPGAYAAETCNSGFGETDRGEINLWRGVLCVDLEDIILQYAFYRYEVAEGVLCCHCAKCGKSVAPDQRDSKKCSDPKCGNQGKGWKSQRPYNGNLVLANELWNCFETENVGTHIEVTEGGKVISAAEWGTQNYTTAHTGHWVSSSEYAGGTVTRLDSTGIVEVGIIITPTKPSDMIPFPKSAYLDGHMAQILPEGATSLSYDDEGNFTKEVDSEPQDFKNGFQLATNIGDKITVVVKDGKVWFRVNGVLQGTPLDLPPDQYVTMAVSLIQAEVRVT